MSGTKKRYKIDPTFALGTLKTSKQLIANMGTITIFARMTRTGIICINI